MTETPIEYEQLQQTSFDQHHARTTKRRKRFLHSARTVLSWNSWGLVFQLFRAEQARTHEQIKAPTRKQQQQQRRKRFLHSARTVLSWTSWGLVFQLFRAEQALSLIHI